MKGQAHHSETKVWVVSVSTATQRREAFRQTVLSQAVDWEFLDAHTTLSEGLSYDQETAVRLIGRPLQAGELGCYSSHFHLWKWLDKSESHHQMIVVEDDVCVDWNYIADIQHVDFGAMGIEYLRLFAKMPAPWRFVASPFLDKYRHLVQFTGYALGTQIYLLTKAGARKFMAHGKNVEAPVDRYMDRTWQHGVLNLAIFPFPAYERHQPSSIGESRFAQFESSVWERLRGTPVRVHRRLQRLWLTYGLTYPRARCLSKRLRRVS